MSIKQYLLDNCVEEDGPLETRCFVWTGPRYPQGYGQVCYGGGYARRTPRCVGSFPWPHPSRDADKS
jgi:hypothetical protein